MNIGKCVGTLFKEAIGENQRDTTPSKKIIRVKHKDEWPLKTISLGTNLNGLQDDAISLRAKDYHSKSNLDSMRSTDQVKACTWGKA